MPTFTHPTSNRSNRSTTSAGVFFAMLYRTIAVLALAVALALGLASVSSAAAPPVSLKKAIWGPVFRDGVSQFPIYRDLGAGIYETNLRWADIAPQRPSHPTDQNDLAYRWPSDVDAAVREAAKYHMRLAPAHLCATVG